MPGGKPAGTGKTRWWWAGTVITRTAMLLKVLKSAELSFWAYNDGEVPKRPFPYSFLVRREKRPNSPNKTQCLTTMALPFSSYLRDSPCRLSMHKSQNLSCQIVSTARYGRKAKSTSIGGKHVLNLWGGSLIRGPRVIVSCCDTPHRISAVLWKLRRGVRFECTPCLPLLS